MKKYPLPLWLEPNNLTIVRYHPAPAAVIDRIAVYTPTDLQSNDLFKERYTFRTLEDVMRRLWVRKGDVWVNNQWDDHLVLQCVTFNNSVVYIGRHPNDTWSVGFGISSNLDYRVKLTKPESIHETA